MVEIARIEMNHLSKGQQRLAGAAFRASFLLCCLLLPAPVIRVGATELITQDGAPYTYQDANWRAGNYIQSLFYSSSSLPALSENFIGMQAGIPHRQPDLYYIGNTGLDLLAYCEEAEFTPVVRLELIKKLFKAMIGSRYEDADALWLVYSGTSRQTSFLVPCGTAFPPYPASRLMARNLPDTGPENLALVHPRIKVAGQWQDAASASRFVDVKSNALDEREGSFTTQRDYCWAAGTEGSVVGRGWRGNADRMLEVTLSAPAATNREAAQLVFSSLTDPHMGFSAPYPTLVPETVQLPDGTEFSGRDLVIENPGFDHLIIYTKDVAGKGFEYQNAMLFAWKQKPSKVTVLWGGAGSSVSHEAYAGTEGITDRQKAGVSGGYHEVRIEYGGQDALSCIHYLERFQGVDPSLSLRHLHKIATNMLARGMVGKPGYLSTESSWLEEPVSALPAAARILAKYDREEDSFGGDMAADAVRYASQIVEDRMAMWRRGRKSSNTHEYVSGAYYMSLLHSLPGRFHSLEKSSHYRELMNTWAGAMVANHETGPRTMISIWRAFEATGNEACRKLYEEGRARFKISDSTGLEIGGQWKDPTCFYDYGDVLGALGRRGTAQDARDIQSLVTYLTAQKRWTDNGYMGCWWEVTVENHNYFGRWCKGLGMEKAPKQIVGISEFPVYYKAGDKVVVERRKSPPLYNPSYWDPTVMKSAQPLLPNQAARSILFRINNILLKNDYQNNWWSGTRSPSARTSLGKITENVGQILAQLEAGSARTSGKADVQRLLKECDTLFQAAAKELEPEIKIDGRTCAIPINPGSELGACRNNFDYLRKLLGE